MKQLTTTKTTLLVVKVPENATDFALGNHCICWKSESCIGERDTNGWCQQSLGLFGGKDYQVNDKYEILGLSNELTEEVWKELMETRIDGKWTFYRNYGDGHPWFDSVDSSVQSLFEANGIHWTNPHTKPEEPWFNDSYMNESGSERYSGEMESYREDLHEYEQAEQNSGPFLVLKLIEV